MKKVILLNKKEGETPLQSLERFRSGRKVYKNVKMTYAGRLDPMASGLLLVLAGEECKNKEKYLKLDKEYEFSVLFGFATDTYDILGKITHYKIIDNIIISDLKKNLKFFRGRFQQKYPLYSSKTIKSARAGEVVEAPEKEVKIPSLNFIKLKSVSYRKLLENVERRIKKVKGDFRQKEILTLWRKHLTHIRHGVYVGEFEIKCSSGTYVRSIANSLGERLGVPALAYKIKRTKIGKWSKM